MFDHDNTAKADAAKARLEHQYAALKANLEDIVRKLEPASSGFLGRARAQIAKYPLVAVGAAFGVGYLVMRIARRR